VQECVTYAWVCVQLSVSALNWDDKSLADMRTVYIRTRLPRDATPAQFDYSQPLRLSVTEGRSPVALATLSAGTTQVGATSGFCYYIVGSLSHRVWSVSCLIQTHTSSIYFILFYFIMESYLQYIQLQQQQILLLLN